MPASAAGTQLGHVRGEKAPLDILQEVFEPLG
jgi:hypothetical protein